MPKVTRILTISLAIMFFASALGCQSAAAQLRGEDGPSLAQGQDLSIQVVPDPLDIGGPARVTIQGLDMDAAPEGHFDGRPIFFFPTKGGVTGIFGADIMIQPGVYPLTISFETSQGTRQETIDVTVLEKDYGTRNITVPQSQVQLSQVDQERAAREKVLTDRALATVSPYRLWHGEFLEPVDAAINSSFGRKTRMNGILSPRPHAGADYRAPEGAPVRCPADGVVILTGDHFFSGKAIYIDHGQGLISMYFHLSEILVSEGKEVKKGETPIGLVGKTGRVTGAHLHYGVYLNGARIDPSAFRKLSGSLNE